jgi:putative nucleotidyltransferase with HDIG domain
MDKKALLATIYTKIDELPTLPAVVPKLLSLMEDATSDTRAVTEAVSHDPSLTAKILKVANSAYYGFPQEITDLERGVALLGFNMVKSLALSLGVLRNLQSDKTRPHFSQEDLWLHSVGVATAMRELGLRHGKGEDNDTLFIVGLLHDVGKVVLDQFFSDLFQRAFDRSISRNEALHLSEREIIGFDHGQVGGYLLDRWKFPEIISHPIAIHHQTDLPEDGNPSDLAILRIADALSSQIILEESDASLIPQIGARDLETLQMKEEDVADITNYLEGTKAGIHAFFNAMI